ncbi:MAG: hypothetical protein ACYTFG_05525 [Planctomycetota bacterium]|jgi:hypothetical protein
MRRGFLSAVMLLALPSTGWPGESPVPRKGGEESVQDRIERWVLKLGSESWADREEASRQLIHIGFPAIPLLKKALSGDDPEVRMRAKSLLAEIGTPGDAVLLNPRAHIFEKMEAFGGGRRTASAALMALAWLKSHQCADGTWGCRSFVAQCKRGECTGPGASDTYDIGLTGLAACAFLAGGHSIRGGKYKETVKRAVRVLKYKQTEDGAVGPKTGDGHWIYNHAIATLALAEFYGQSGQSAALRMPAQKAVDFLVECQNPHFGWRYGRQTGEGDTSVTGWAVLALKVAEECGLKVRKEAFDGALNWFAKATDDAYYQVGYRSKGDRATLPPGARGKFQPNEAMTAMGVLCRCFILGPKAVNRPEIIGGANLLKRNPPKWDVKGGTIDMHYWHWGTLASFQVGRQYWKRWNEPMKNALVPTQKREGCENGSWDPVGAWGKAGGRVYATALNALTLQIYHRYKRVLNVK